MVSHLTHQKFKTFRRGSEGSPDFQWLIRGGGGGNGGEGRRFGSGLLSFFHFFGGPSNSQPRQTGFLSPWPLGISGKNGGMSFWFSFETPTTTRSPPKKKRLK